MGDIEKWKAAKSPNYDTNRNKFYPYSELPYLGQYKLVKIPACLTNLIEHVDYLGEGRIETDSGSIGFRDSYNVHYEYHLVSKGRDNGRKIPNRIPFISGTGDNCCTRNYIKDNSVLTITVARFNFFLTKSCICDIARIVNSDMGKVIIYGYDESDSDICEIFEFLSEELLVKQLFYCPIYLLPEHFQLPYYNTCYKAYLSLNELKKELFNYVKKGDYEAAMILTRCLSNVYCCAALGDVVNKLLENRDTNVMVYAYKLWNNNARDIVCKHFPATFKLIFNGDCMKIINKQFNQALKLYEEGDFIYAAWGDNHHETSHILSWKIIPILENDNIIFKLYNVYNETYIKLDPSAEQNGSRHVRGSNNSKELSTTFCLEPLLVNGEIAFTILNCEYGQRLKLADDIYADGDRYVFGQLGFDKHECLLREDECFMWMLAPLEHLDGHDKSNVMKVICIERAHDCLLKNSSIMHLCDL